MSALERAGAEQQHSIFVGPRTFAEFDFVTSVLYDLTIGLNASSKYREQRWRQRHLSFDDKWEQREFFEESWETAKLVDQCDIIVNANQSIGNKTSKILSRIKGARWERQILPTNDP